MKNIALFLFWTLSLVFAQAASAGDLGRLEAAVRTWANEPRAPNYEYAFVDLNEDGVDDAVVLITARDYCGSGGCSLVIFRGAAGGYKLVSSSTITREPIFLLQEKRYGWHTLSVQVAGGSIESGQALMQFNGTKYPLNPSLQPRAKESDLKGAQRIGLSKD